MKELLLLLLATIVTLNCYAQITFEQGYYIDNSGQKVECLIKNIDWRKNPIDFEYKLSEGAENQKATIETTQEFGVYNESKYVRTKVEMDRSSSDLKYLSNEMKPIFNEEELFLKVLLEGKASLYSYEDTGLIRYFYKTESSDIKQLIYKLYNTSANTARKNNQFHQQLWNDLKCEGIKLFDIQGLGYFKKDLFKFFVKYNQCHNVEIMNPIKKEKRDLFNLNLRPHLKFSSLRLQNASSFSLNDTKFGYNLGYGLGAEAEFILPFNKNKWAIFIEPTFHHLKSVGISNRNNIPGEKTTITLNYNSLEIPIGARYYIFLNDNSKIFINTALVIDFNFNSLFEFERVDQTPIEPLYLNTIAFNPSLGLGYKLNDKYSAEFRYHTNRPLINYAEWKSNYKTLEFILGYSLF